MKIYTKSGDGGETGLFGGARLPKNHIRIEAYGTVDELNANIGLLRDHCQGQDIRDFLKDIQIRLFNIGSILATAKDKKAPVTSPQKEDIQVLEKEMDRMEEGLQPLKNFILPGGHPVVSYAHMARVVCRHAERRIVTLHQNEEVDLSLVKYLNRLSDYFFVLGRHLSKQMGVEEVLWSS